MRDLNLDSQTKEHDGVEHPGNLARQDEAGGGSPVRGSHSRQTARTALYTRLILGDALSVIVGFSLASLFREDRWLMPDGFNLTLLVVPILLSVAAANGSYSLHVLQSFAESSRQFTKASVITFFLLMTILFGFQVSEEISRVGIATAISTMLACALLLRYLAYRWTARTLHGDLFDELLICDGPPPAGAKSSFKIDAALNNLTPDLDDPAMVERFAQVVEFYDRVVVSCPIEREAAWATLLKSCDVKGEILVSERRHLGVIGIDTFGDLGTLVVSRDRMRLSDRIKKRVFDLAIAIPALVFLAPLLLVVAVLIKLDSPGPVFFRQLRIGRYNKPFRIYKFRSMRQEAGDAAGHRSTGRDDDRVSRFGRFIRRTSIDEIPQLLNVISGDMSIVGPRPHAFGSRAENQLFWEISPRYWERHLLQPGITGLAQVRGFRGATERTHDLVSRLQADLEYLQNWSLWRDTSIIFATLRVLVHPNAY